MVGVSNANNSLLNRQLSTILHSLNRVSGLSKEKRESRFHNHILEICFVLVFFTWYCVKTVLKNLLSDNTVNSTNKNCQNLQIPGKHFFHDLQNLFYLI